MELIQTIKANNLNMEDKIQAEQLELEHMKSGSDNTAKPPVQPVSQRTTPRPFSASDAIPGEVGQGMEDDANAEEALIQATMNV